MFSYDLSDVLRKKLKKIAKKDRILAQNFYRKVQEVIKKDEGSINTYKNLKSPMNEFKRIHLTDNFILVFAVQGNHIVFVDIKHRDVVYKNR